MEKVWLYYLFAVLRYCRWVAKNISEDIDEEIGVYAGGDKSGIFYHGEWRTESRDKIKNWSKNVR